MSRADLVTREDCGCGSRGNAVGLLNSPSPSRSWIQMGDFSWKPHSTASSTRQQYGSDPTWASAGLGESHLPLTAFAGTYLHPGTSVRSFHTGRPRSRASQTSSSVPLKIPKRATPDYVPCVQPNALDSCVSLDMNRACARLDLLCEFLESSHQPRVVAYKFHKLA